MTFWIIEIAYLVASALFVMSLHWMNDPKTARRGVGAGVAAMTLAIVGTLFNPGIVNWGWIAGAVAAGVLIGVPLSWVPLTAVPQRTAVSHAFGGLAAGPRGGREVLPVAGRAGELHCLPHLRPRGRGDPGLPHLHRQPHGGGQAPGGEVDPPAAGHLPDAERDQHRPARARGRLRRRPRLEAGRARLPLPGDHRPRPRLRDPAHHPDRRGGHAHRDLAPQLLRRPLRGGDGLRPRQQAARDRGRPRRQLRPHPVDHHVPGHEPLVHERALRGLRAGAAEGGRRRDAHRQEGDAGGRGPGAGDGEPGGDRARLRDGGRPGPAARARALRRAHAAADRGEVRDPPGGRAHAGPHERAPRRGGHPLRQAHRDGRHQPRDAADGRGAGDRGERRGEPRRAARQVEPDLRHADHRRGQGADVPRHQALDEPRLRRDRERALLRRPHLHAVRRRQGGGGRPRQAALRRPGSGLPSTSGTSRADRARSCTSTWTRSSRRSSSATAPSCGGSPSSWGRTRREAAGAASSRPPPTRPAASGWAAPCPSRRPGAGARRASTSTPTWRSTPASRSGSWRSSSASPTSWSRSRSTRRSST